MNPDTKTLRIFLRNLLAGIGINSAGQLMSLRSISCGLI